MIQKNIKRYCKNEHTIANHTYSHNYNYLYPNGVINVYNFMKDIEKNNELIKNILGKDFNTRVIRFPGGYWSWDGREYIKEVLIDNGYIDIFWNVINKDGEGWNNMSTFLSIKSNINCNKSISY